MARLGLCGCCCLWALVPMVTAESGDDFSNNLVSDLAPLLTLFGERVTMQFMSQSTGWADNLALAMAPLGVITIMVGAIRVGGPSWLRALIGRARENTAVAEAELMSSTSNEVCELWNGQEVVRVMGTAPIREFLCLTPPGSIVKHLKPTFCSLDKAMEKGYMKKYETSTIQRLWSLILHLCYPGIQPSQDEETGTNPDSKSQPELNEFLIIHNSKIQAPNLSFNIHNFNKRGEIQAVAAIGTLVQAAVILYAAFATYHPTLRFAKDGSAVASYAFPCMATGSVVLVLGMLIAAHVVESSTEEERYRPKDGVLAWAFWLQKAETVSDQSFESFLISTETPKDLIMTSQRADPHKSGKLGLGIVEYWLELLTIIATAISVCGYVIQFVGLRGLHWSITIVQLGATVLMTVLRAWVRRGLSRPPKVHKIPSDYELDWFATHLALRGSIHLHDGQGDEKRDSIELHKQHKKEEALAREFRKVNIRADARRDTSRTAPSKPSIAQKALHIRSQFGHASKWPGIAFKEAMAAANAIEVIMNLLNPLLESRILKKKRFAWSLETPRGPIRLTVKYDRRKERWHADASKIDSVLSLWLFWIQGKEQQERASELGRKDAWLRGQEAIVKKSLRLLGPCSPQLRRDLKWWMPPAETGMIRWISTKLSDQGVALAVPSHRVVGHGWVSDSEPTFEVISTPFNTSGDFVPETVAVKPVSKSVGRSQEYLAVESTESLTLVYAQELFASFVREVSQSLTGPIKGDAVIHPSEPLKGPGGSALTWKNFILQNNHFNQMAREVHSTGICGFEEAFIYLIPPLSDSERLPRANEIVKWTRKHSLKYEQMNDWEQLRDSYLWLFRIGTTYPPLRPGEDGTSLHIQAAAILTEYLRSVMFALEWNKALRANETSIQLLEKIGKQIVQELKGTDGRVLSALVSLNDKQRRNGVFDIESTLGTESVSTKDIDGISTSLKVGNDGLDVDVFHWTSLHYEATTGEISNLTQSDFLTAVNMKDLSGQTPLHLAVGMNDITLLSSLIEAGAILDDKRADGKTPLHCAIMNARFDSVRMLIEAGANVNAIDSWKQTPLHLAAWFGDQETIDYLLQFANSLAADIEGRTPLHIAVLSRLQRNCESFLEFNKDLIHAKDEKGWTPLHLAVDMGLLSLVRLLVGFGARIKKKAQPSPRGQTPLDLAASGGHEDILGFLLENNAYPIRAARILSHAESRTPLYYAVVNGQTRIVGLLLDHGLTVYEYTDFGKTLLHHAAQHGMAEIIPRLLSRGVYVDSRDENHRTPLHFAAEYGKTEAARSLLEAQAKVDARTYPQRQTPLFIACKTGEVEVAQLLLKHCASLECSDQDGKSPLHIAAENGHLPLVQLLLENHADVDILVRDHSHLSTTTTPLAYAALAGHVDVVQYLLRRGRARMVMNDAHSCLPVIVDDGHLHVISALLHAEPGLNPAAKAKALQKAASCGQSQILQLLVQNGADYTATDQRKRTALHHAAPGGWHEIVERLLNLGLDVNAVDVDGQTALHKAAQGPREFEEESDRELIVQALMNQGSRVDARDNQGRTPLFIAARHMHWPVLRQFLRIPNEYMEQDLALAISERLQDQDEIPTRSAVQDEIQALINRARATPEDERKQSLATDGQSRMSASEEDSDDEDDDDEDDDDEDDDDEDDDDEDDDDEDDDDEDDDDEDDGDSSGED